MSVYITPYVTPVIDTALYSTGDALGAVSFFPSVPEKGTIMSANIIDLDSESAVYTALELYLFSSEPTSVANNAAFDLTDADLSLCVGVIDFLSGTAAEIEVLADNTFLHKMNIGLPYWARTGRLYFQLRVIGGPTFAAADDIKVALGIVY